MRVLLIQPPSGETIGLSNVFLAEPLGLEMVAASLGSTHECTILDMRLEPNLDAAIASFRPDACGISCSFTPEVTRTIRIAQRIKRRLPECFVFVGGHHASQRPGDYAGSVVDAVVVGDGEASTRVLLQAMDRTESIEELPGILAPAKIPADGDSHKAVFPDMAGLPLPARQLVDRYRSRYQMGLEWPVYSVETARGCPYRCTFCSVWELYGGKRRERPVQEIVEDLDSIDGEHVFFTDDLFFLDDKRAETLAFEIQRAGIKKNYTCQSRADGIIRQREAVRLWKEIGLRRIFVGLESANDAGLQSVNKGYDSSTNERALEILDEVGVAVNGQFIVAPEFSVEDFQSLLDYVKRQGIAFPSFTILTPLPGTRLYRERCGELLTEDPEMYDLFHCVLPTRLPLEHFYRSFAGLYKESYFGRTPWLPSYRILRYLLSVDGARRFFATTRNLRRLCRAESYLRAHDNRDLHIVNHEHYTRADEGFS